MILFLQVQLVNDGYHPLETKYSIIKCDPAKFGNIYIYTLKYLIYLFLVFLFILFL